MGKYVLKRIIWMIPVILGVAVIIFTIMYFCPGDPAAVILGSNATEAELAAKRVELGLDQSYFVRLFDYLSNVFLHFDFGKSYITNTSISNEIITRFPRTLIIAVACIILSAVVGIPLGINAAVHRGGIWDNVSMLIALVGVSMPSFWIALMMVLAFSLKLGWLPASGIGGFQYYIMPVIANSFGEIAILARQTRSSMLEVIRSDYVATARSKGQNKYKVILGHVLPNALIPVITVAGTSFGRSLGGTVIIENVFSIPGIGQYMITGINNRDYTVVQGCVIFLAISFSIVMLLVDLLYAFIDPRIKAQYVGSKRRKKK